MANAITMQPRFSRCGADRNSSVRSRTMDLAADGRETALLPQRSHRACADALIVQIGTGIAIGGCAIPIAFNATGLASLAATSLAIGVGVGLAGLAVPALWRATWRGVGLGQRLVLAGVCVAAALVAQPGQYVLAVAQVLWGLSDGGAAG